MARRGTVTPEVQALLDAAREQWGSGAVEEYSSGQYKVRPRDKARPLIYVSGKGAQRGYRNARSMLRQAGLAL